MNTLSFSQLEQIYDELAQAIDQVGTERESIFLAKLVILLSNEYGNGARVSELIQQCLRDDDSEAQQQHGSQAPQTRLI